MTRAQFDQFVLRIERRLGSRPFALRLRIALLVALGYSVFLFWFFLVFAIGTLFFAGAVAVDTGIGLVLLVVGSLLLTFGGLQAAGLLWIGVKVSPGRVLRRREAPQLFEILARLRAGLKAARFGRVRMTPEFNASVALVPRLGVFGWSRRILDLGLPLLECLSAAEFEAVLAHEFAHLSKRHGRFGAWIYRVRRTWERLFEQFQEPAKSKGGRMLRASLAAFVRWYWPRFNAYAFVLSRTNEYDADRCAAEWAGNRDTASALWRIECQSRRLQEEFWPALEQLANTQPEPPTDFTGRMAAALAQPPAVPDAVRWMQRATQALTDNLDTHPSLSDRLRALGQPVDAGRAARFPDVPRPSAAAALLGERLESVRQDVDLLWRRQIDETWRGRHKRAISLQYKLATLEETPRAPESDPARLWARARATLDLSGPAAAEPLLRQLLAAQPAHSAANLVLGRILLDRGHAEGEQLLRTILDKEDDELIPDACQVLDHYFQSAGAVDRVYEVRQQLSRFETAAAAAGRERTVVSASDRFLPHDLTPDELSALRAVLAAQPDLGSAYLARKDLKHFPRQRLFVLCVRSAAGFWSPAGGERDAAVAARLVSQVALPGRAIVISPHAGFRRLGRKIAALRGAQVFPVQ